MQGVQITDEMQKGFEASIAVAEDQLAKGQFQEALNNYKTVMPFQPDGRVRAGMALLALIAGCGIGLWWFW